MFNEQASVFRRYRTWVGHNVAHVWNGAIPQTLVEVNKTAGLRPDVIKVRQPVAADSRNKKILMICNRRPADNVLQVKNTTGTFRMLTDEVENIHRLNFPLLRIRYIFF